MESIPRVSVKNLSRSFGSVKAVSSLTLSLNEGEIYGLIGPDGAGKTTSLRMITGVLENEEGEVTVNGIDVKKFPEKAREHLGYMPQAYGLYSDLTVYENMKFFSMLLGITGRKFQSRSDEILSFVKLSQFKDRKAGALSGGMYKKLAIACSIIHSPKVLILDEPTNGVDPVSRRDLWSLFFSLSEQKVSILVSTPYMDEAERCHRTGLIFHGRLLKEGTPESLMQNLKNRILSVKSDNSQEMMKFLKNSVPNLNCYHFGTEIHLILPPEKEDSGKIIHFIIEKSNIQNCQVRKADPSFEDVFMESSGGQNE
jgi:ABC-2 type transport system ATP-binding protein